MRTLAATLKSAGESGQPLPQVFQGLMENDVHIRMGELTIIFSAPGVGKSFVATNLAVKAKVPTLYFSPDTSGIDMGARVSAMITGRRLTEVHAALQGEEGKHEYAQAVTHATQHIRWVWESSLSTVDINKHVAAFAVAWGDYPTLIVVDSLRNIELEGETEVAGFRANIDYLHRLARDTGSAVVVLHHSVGTDHDGVTPPNLRSLEGKISHLPAVVIGLFRGKYGDVGATILKNRSGPSDPSGYLRFYFSTDFERARFS